MYSGLKGIITPYRVSKNNMKPKNTKEPIITAEALPHDDVITTTKNLPKEWPEKKEKDGNMTMEFADGRKADLKIHSDIAVGFNEAHDLCTNALPSVIESVRRETEKAFGGCKNCYGKGYSTVKDFTVGHEDFGGEGFIRENNPMRFCKCDRGKQLQAINPTPHTGE